MRFLASFHRRGRLRSVRYCVKKSQILDNDQSDNTDDEEGESGGMEDVLSGEKYEGRT